MTTLYKYLIQLNNHKYSVFIESNNKFITFCNVLNEIQNQTKQNISYETHFFELFDNDFEEYVLITNDKHIIENLSRIRVSVKSIQNNNNIKTNQNIEVFGNNCFKEDNNKCINCSNICQNLDKTENNSNTKVLNTEKAINSKLSEFNNNINNKTTDISTKLKDINNEKVVIKEVINNSIIESNDKSLKPKFNGKSSSIVSENSTSSTNTITNYLGFIPKSSHSSTSSQLSFDTKVVKIGNISTIALVMNSIDIKAFQKLIQIMVNKRQYFRINSSNDLTINDKWIVVSNQMIINGHKDWSPQKCRDCFLGSINWYKKILEKTSNYAIASGIYPLFELIHNSMDLKYFLKTENFESISRMRELFAKKCAESTNDTRLEPKKIVRVVTNSVYKQNYSSRLRDSDEYPYYETKTVMNKDNYPIGSSFRELIQKTTKITDLDIKEFKLLAETLDDVIEQFGRYGFDLWQLVSNRMKANGYCDFNTKKCENKYLNYICDYYKMALIHCKDYKTAASVYPLFELIHAMDLSKTLSYKSFHKIHQLKERFDRKFAYK